MVPPSPLHRPVEFFSDPPPWATSPAVAVGVAFASGLVLAVGFYALGLEIAEQFTGTVTVDNPAYPGDLFCESHSGSETGTSWPGEACDEPAQVERDPEPIVRDAFREASVYLFIGWLIAWAVGAILLHVAAKVADGEGSMGETFAIAAWSGVPSVVTSMPAILVISRALESAELTLEDPDATIQAIEAAIAQVEPLLLVFTLIGTTWQAAIWYGGLRGRHRLQVGAAAVIAGLFWAISFAMTL
ncbi:Yip1 family protein [Salinarchaeum chitinilyticum]